MKKRAPVIIVKQPPVNPNQISMHHSFSLFHNIKHHTQQQKLTTSSAAYSTTAHTNSLELNTAHVRCTADKSTARRKVSTERCNSRGRVVSVNIVDDDDLVKGDLRDGEEGGGILLMIKT